MDLYMKEREKENPMPTAKAGAQCLLTREDDGEEEKMMNCLSIQREGKLWTYI
jgi:hypothetical protein